MPDRPSVLIFAGLVGGSLILTLVTIPSGIMIPIMIAVFTGIGLAVSPDRSFISLWKKSPKPWRIVSCIFVVLVPVILPPRGELHLLLGIFLAMLALSGVILLLGIMHLILREGFGLHDSDD